MSIAENLKQIQNQIKIAAAKAERDPAGIKIIAVTKYVDVTAMNEAIRSGITDIGENRVQDGKNKFPLLEGAATKHLIGTLQTNKVSSALAIFDFIHSVDRIELVEAIAKQASKLEQPVKFLIQVNISGEASKHGLVPANVPEFLERIKRISYLIPCGLMTIAPLVDQPEKVRPIFRALKKLFDESAVRFDHDSNWRYLSMGMSQDYQIAVEEGANLLRIGTAIFHQD